MINCNFNELPDETKFLLHGIPFVKIASAIPRVPLDKQKPNCINLNNNHKCVVGAKCIVEVILEDECDDKSEQSYCKKNV